MTSLIRGVTVSPADAAKGSELPLYSVIVNEGTSVPESDTWVLGTAVVPCLDSVTLAFSSASFLRREALAA
jgi:hypothetical protein